MTFMVTTADSATWDAFVYRAKVELFEDLVFTRRRNVGRHTWIVDTHIKEGT